MSQGNHGDTLVNKHALDKKLRPSRPHHRDDSCSPAGLHAPLSHKHGKASELSHPQGGTASKHRWQRYGTFSCALCGILYIRKKQKKTMLPKPNKDAPLSIITRE